MYINPQTLIIKLKAHLERIKGIAIPVNIFDPNHDARLDEVHDEVKLMLALIEGYKES